MWQRHQDRPRKDRGDQNPANNNRTEDSRKILEHMRLLSRSLAGLPTVVAPLYMLLRKDTELDWSKEHNKEFQYSSTG
jgi:hypothetical protein